MERVVITLFLGSVSCLQVIFLPKESTSFFIQTVVVSFAAFSKVPLGSQS
jgi:hypothetical protein